MAKLVRVLEVSSAQIEGIYDVLLVFEELKRQSVEFTVKLRYNTLTFALSSTEYINQWITSLLK